MKRLSWSIFTAAHGAVMCWGHNTTVTATWYRTVFGFETFSRAIGSCYLTESHERRHISWCLGSAHTPLNWAGTSGAGHGPSFRWVHQIIQHTGGNGTAAARLTTEPWVILRGIRDRGEDIVPDCSCDRMNRMSLMEKHTIWPGTRWWPDLKAPQAPGFTVCGNFTYHNFV